jgi:hypothetical protein
MGVISQLSIFFLPSLSVAYVCLYSLYMCMYVCVCISSYIYIQTATYKWTHIQTYTLFSTYFTQFNEVALKYDFIYLSIIYLSYIYQLSSFISYITKLKQIPRIENLIDICSWFEVKINGILVFHSENGYFIPVVYQNTLSLYAM